MRDAEADRLFGWEAHLLPFAVRGRARAAFAYQRTVLRGYLSGTPSPPLGLPTRGLPLGAPPSKEIYLGLLYDRYAFRATFNFFNRWTRSLHIHRARCTRNTYRTSAGEPPEVPTGSESNKLSCLRCGLLSCQWARLLAVLLLKPQGHSCLPTFAHSPPLYQSKYYTLFNNQNKFNDVFGDSSLMLSI